MKRVALLFLDLLLIACATIFAVLLRDNLELRDPDLQAILPYLVVTLLSGAVCLLDRRYQLVRLALFGAERLSEISRRERSNGSHKPRD